MGIRETVFSQEDERICLAFEIFTNLRRHMSNERTATNNHGYIPNFLNSGLQPRNFVSIMNTSNTREE